MLVFGRKLFMAVWFRMVLVRRVSIRLHVVLSGLARRPISGRKVSFVHSQVSHTTTNVIRLAEHIIEILHASVFAAANARQANVYRGPRAILLSQATVCMIGKIPGFSCSIPFSFGVFEQAPDLWFPFIKQGNGEQMSASSPL